jgi:uncharacterized protein YPO0396
MKKLIEWVLIVGMLVLVIFLLSPYSPLKPGIDQPAKVRDDSVKIAKASIAAIQDRERALIARIASDSVERQISAQRHNATVTQLQKRIRAINLERASGHRLDSIRNILYPGWSAIDSPYVMPIYLARDALQALEREPLRDSLEGAQTARISEQEAEIQEAEDSYKALDSARLAEIAKKDVIIRNREAMLDDCQEDRKKEKKATFWRKVLNTGKDVGIGVIGFLLGRA